MEHLGALSSTLSIKVEVVDLVFRLDSFLEPKSDLKLVEKGVDYRLMCDFQLHGNPGDYAWGRGGLDAIITQVQFREGYRN